MKGKKMFYKSKWFQLGVAAILCLVVLLLPRPEGNRFTIKGDGNHVLLQYLNENFKLVNDAKNPTDGYTVEVKSPKVLKSPGKYLGETAKRLKLKDLQIDYVDGLSPKAKRFLAVLAMLVFLFVAEPIPLEITAICIGVFLVITGINGRLTFTRWWSLLCAA
jgi:sodium-dependent dicarboxylate transporter 2/3/5